MKRSITDLAILLFVSGVIRAWSWVSTRGIAPWGDELSQLSHAWDLAWNGVQHVFWPPLSIWISAALFLVLGSYDYPTVRLAWLFLDLLNVVLAYFLCRRLFDIRTGFWAAFLYAVYPSAIARAVYMTSEVPCILLGLGALLCLVSSSEKRHIGWACATGTCVGLMALARGAMLPLLGLLPAATALSDLGGPSGKKRLQTAAAMVAAGLAVWLPWAVRNRIVGDQWVLVSTNATYNLASSAVADEVGAQDSMFLFRPWASTEQRALRREVFGSSSTAASGASTEAAPVARQTPAQEFAENRLHGQRALEGIARDPGFYVASCLGRVARFWALDTEVKELAGSERWGSIFAPAVLVLIASSNLIYVPAVWLAVAGFMAYPCRKVRLISAIYVAAPLIGYALVYAKPRYHLTVMPLVFGFAVWCARNASICTSRLTVRRRAVLGLTWLSLAWVWAAWLVFCVTSRVSA